MCNIEKNDVYNSETNEVKEYGTTLEKRGKCGKFPIFDIVKNPLKKWISENHMIDSPYIFPNSRDYTQSKSTMHFQKLFKDVAIDVDMKVMKYMFMLSDIL